MENSPTMLPILYASISSDFILSFMRYTFFAPTFSKYDVIFQPFVHTSYENEAYYECRPLLPFSQCPLASTALPPFSPVGCKYQQNLFEK
jgi:hypothetical protein